MKHAVKMDVMIPAGVADGETLKVSGAGEAGKYGVSSGDLFLNIHLKQHLVFQRRGNDLFTRAEISFSQAVLGVKINVPMIDGFVKLTVPVGTSSRKTFRIKGRGMSHGNARNMIAGGGRGDAYVTVSVRIPQKISKHAQKLLEELEGEL